MINNDKMTDYNIEYWINENEVKNIKYFDYWNDEEEEKKKEWYILDGNFSKMEEYLIKSGLLADLNRSIVFLKKHFRYELKGVGLDLASGNCWAAPYILNAGKVNKLYCLEYSKHRLLKIGPKVLEHYNILKDKIVLVYGSFYNLHLQDNSVDFVFLSQAFHHADKPEKLLTEIKRVLKKDGVVIITGEDIASSNYFTHFSKNVIKFFISKFMPSKTQQKLFKKTFKVNTFFPEPQKKFLVDNVLGDYRYNRTDYYLFFKKHDFKVKYFKKRKSLYHSFILFKK